jgi:hypothetical protein
LVLRSHAFQVGFCLLGIFFEHAAGLRIGRKIERPEVEDAGVAAVGAEAGVVPAAVLPGVVLAADGLPGTIVPVASGAAVRSTVAVEAGFGIFRIRMSSANA